MTTFQIALRRTIERINTYEALGSSTTTLEALLLLEAEYKEALEEKLAEKVRHAEEQKEAERRLYNEVMGNGQH